MRRLLAALLLLSATGCSDGVAPEPPTSPSASSPPVLLVHGYGGVASDFALVEAALAEAGREVVLVELDQDWPDFASQVAILEDAVGASEEVDVVGFSAGGLVVRQWAAEGGLDAARRVVTIATPNHGTRRAALGDCTGACLELLAGSDLLTSLNAGDETPAGAEWVTIWSSSDGTVVPAESARLDGAREVQVQELCPARSPDHLEMLSEPVPAIVVAVLGGEDPDASAC